MIAARRKVPIPPEIKKERSLTYLSELLNPLIRKKKVIKSKTRAPIIPMNMFIVSPLVSSQ